MAATVPLSADSMPGHRYMQLDTPYARVLWSGRTLWDCSGIRQRLIAVSVVSCRSSVYMECDSYRT